MSETRPVVTVLIPALNEEDGIAMVLEELKRAVGDLGSFLVIDGQSKDRTVEIAKDFNCDVFVQEGKGKGQAIREILQKRAYSTRYVALIDGDYTYPAEYIPKMIQILELNLDVGMVTGDRLGGGDLEMPWLFYVGNKILSRVQWWANGVKLNDPLTGLRVVRRELLSGWMPRSRGFDIEAELNHHVRRSGRRIVELPIKYRKRVGKKKLGFRHGFSILLRIIQLSA